MVNTSMVAVTAKVNQSAKAGRFMTIGLLALAMFITGGCGLVYEYIMSSVSTFILGNSVEQFALTMGLMMFMMAIAGFVQKTISDKNIVEKFVFIEILLALIGGFAPISIYAAFGYMEDHFNLVLYISILLIGLLIGLEIPLAMRINEKYAKDLGVNIASTWAFDYFGSLVGSLLFALILIKTLPLTQIGFVVAFANISVAIITLIFFSWRKIITKPASLWMVLIAVAGLLILGMRHNVAWADNLEQKLYDSKIVMAETTKYQRLVMTHTPRLDEYRFYINGNLQFSSADEAIYHEQLIHPVMTLVPDHRRILILGGGDGLALREILKYKDVEDVTMVDLDPEMIRICSTNPILTKLNKNSFRDARVHAYGSSAIKSTGETRNIYQGDGDEYITKDGHKRPKVEMIAQVNVYNVDADRFIDETKGKWNVIVIDLPDPTSIELAKLYSKEFYMKARRVLSENGMMVVQSTSPYHAKEAYLCTMRTIGAAGFNTQPYHDNVPSFGDWGFVLGWKEGRSKESVLGKLNDIQNFQVETRYLSPEVFQRALVFGKGWLQSDHSDVSTTMAPKILKYYLDDGWKIE